MNKTASRALALTSLFALCACGGGGSSAPPPAPAVAAAPATTNVFAAYSNLIRSPHSYSLSGTTSTGVAVTANLGVAQGAQGMFNGVAYDTSTLTLSLFANGVLQSTSVTTLWQDAGTPNWAFLFKSVDGTCTNRTGGSGLPTSAALNTTGAYISGTDYTSCNPTNLPSVFLSIGTLTQTWSYQEISGIPFVCINTSNQQPFTSTEADCFEVTDVNGTVGAHARITSVAVGGVTTTLSN